MLLAAVLSLAGVTANPASAAPPSNDQFANATVITSLPFKDVVDLSQATWDPTTDQSNCSGAQNSVWYQITPSSSGPIAFDTANSGVQVIDAFTGTPGSLTHVGCGYPSLTVNATAGTTYWIMVSNECCGQDGTLDLAVYSAVAPQGKLKINGIGRFDKGGNVYISGTATCTGIMLTPTAVTGSVRQVYQRIYSITATFSPPATGCNGTQSWRALAQPTTGGFAAGYATVNAAVSFCNAAGCANLSATRVITLTALS